MTNPASDDLENGTYLVVANDEEQYSIWPADREPPNGRRRAGMHGTKAECLEHIRVIWTDMRPRSLRERLREAAKIADEPAESDEADAGATLVDRLASGRHPLEFAARPKPRLQSLRHSVERRDVLIKFTGTEGETELGLLLDGRNVDLGSAALSAGQGLLHLEADLTLGFVRVRCFADIQLETLKGQGHLERLD